MSAPNFRLRLPATDFPMRQKYAESEPALAARWRTMSHRRPGAAPFVLLDGPPYANGHLHPGHVLNKSLKDAYARARRMAGHDVEWVLGWDCHGLPVEWNVEKRLLAEGQVSPKQDVLAFRRACREEADRWVSVQRAELERFGLSADEGCYLTMSAASEAAVAREFLRLLMRGMVYEGAKPVLWSPLEDTVMAGAEVEHKDVKQKDATVAFPVARGRLAEERAAFAVWTTTPWTLPLNEGLAVSPTLTYGLYEVEGRLLVMAEALADPGHRLLRTVSLTEMMDAEALRPAPLTGGVPVLPSEHVRGDSGTGVVHLVPAHGPEDYALGKKHGLRCDDRLTSGSRLGPDVPLFGGMRAVSETGEQGEAVFAVLRALRDAGSLLSSVNRTVSSSRSWRSGGPLLYRALPQWFLRLDEALPLAVRQADGVKWRPASAKKRFVSTLEGRPDWLLSRQRAWGVPLPLFVRKGTTPGDPGRVLMDESVNERVLSAFAERSSDVWFEPGFKREVLGDLADDYEQVRDVLDVWFDSGCAKRLSGAGHDRVDLVVEGQDQHRGWFQSQMLLSCAVDGHAPYAEVRAHGFVLDEKRDKLSKSRGNGMSVLSAAAEHGAEVLRLWAATCSSDEDVSLGDEALRSVRAERDAVRNAMRFALGNLTHDQDHRLPHALMFPRERWLLSELRGLGVSMMGAYGDLDTGRAFRELRSFCSGTLSSFYYDGAKDTLYCDAPCAPARQSALSALDHTLRALMTWSAPLMPFTADEAWGHRFSGGSVHQEVFYALPEDQGGFDPVRWAALRALREQWGDVSQRASKAGLPVGMGARAVLDETWSDMGAGLLSDMLGVSQVRFERGGAMRHEPCDDAACARCKRRSPLLSGGLCLRCERAEVDLSP